MLVTAQAASAFIYWGDAENDWIGRANNDGSGVNPNFIKTGEEPVGVAVDASHVYWAEQDGNAIGRANIDGSGVDNSFIAGIAEPTGVAVNGSSIYWDTLTGTVGRAELSGAILNAKLVSGSPSRVGSRSTLDMSTGRKSPPARPLTSPASVSTAASCSCTT
jgi:streptogramin lyase